MGYDYGILTGQMIQQCYNQVFYAVFSDSGIPPEIIPIIELAAELFLDWQVCTSRGWILLAVDSEFNEFVLCVVLVGFVPF